MKYAQQKPLSLVRLLFTALLCAGFGLIHAQPAAKVTQVVGTLVETDASGRTRVLAADSSVSSGTRLRTAAGSYARLRFSDGTELALRPDTEFVVDKYQFEKEQSAGDGFLSSLVKGGFRKITGAIGKRSPNSVRTSAGTSTIGIRGTDFAVRKCDGKCIAEPESQSPRSTVEPPVARVATLEGVAIALEPLSGRERPLESGAALYSGEVVATGEGSRAALYFRDGTRITLAENSVLGVEDFAFDAADPARGRATLVLGLGGARILTGAISKANPDNFVLRTPTASISPRGSWLDVFVSTAQAVAQAVADTAEQVAQAAADAAAKAAQAAQDAARAVGQAVQGAVQAVGQAAQDTARKVGKAVQAAAQKVGKAIQAAGQATGKAAQQTGRAAAGSVKQAAGAVASALDPADAVDTSVTQVSVQDGAALVTTSQGSERIDSTTPGLRIAGDGKITPATGRAVVNAPDPSRFDADPVRLFGESGTVKDDAGVYVLVHDGAVSLAQAGVEIVLVKGEVGFADAKNSPPQIIDTMPPILRHDRLLAIALPGSQMCRP